jgi:DNA invertase Pin-like site-specific DNA recombinase
MKPKKAWSYLRFSSLGQMDNTSLERQLEATRAYCRTHGLELQEDLRDLGISSFRGLNAREGALAGFLKLVEAGKARGDYLLIEEWSRLSRQKPIKSLALFTRIVDEGGVKIVTVQDGRVYDGDNVGDLLLALVSFDNSHRESALKSMRVRAAWKQKIEKAEKNGTVMTAACPKWLKPRPDGTGFDLIEEKVETVRTIFHCAVALDLGSDAIMRHLNKQKIKPLGPSKTWGKSSVARLLKNEAVLGRYTPKTDGVPGDKVLENYFPQVISPGLFHQAQERLQARQGKKGRRGIGFSNLFQGLLQCWNCKGMMRLQSFGDARPRNLCCDNVGRGNPCSQTASWDYLSFQRSFLKFITEVDLQTVMTDTDKVGERKALEDKIRELTAQLADTEKRIGRIQAQMEVEDEATPILRQQLVGLVRNKTDTDKQLRSCRGKLSALTEKSVLVGGELVQLINKLEGMSGDLAFTTRAAVAARLKEIILKVLVSPGSRIAGGANPIRHFGVIFKSGLAKMVTVHPNDPLVFLFAWEGEPAKPVSVTEIVVSREPFGHRSKLMTLTSTD